MRSLEDAKRNGANCMAVGHLALGLDEPDLHCYETYKDDNHFVTVGLAEIRGRDMVIFGEENPLVSPDQFVPRYDAMGYLTNWRESPVRHVAIATGRYENGEPLLLHISPQDGSTVSIWPLSRFRQHPRYAAIRRVARLVHNSNIGGCDDC